MGGHYRPPAAALGELFNNTAGQDNAQQSRQVYHQSGDDSDDNSGRSFGEYNGAMTYYNQPHNQRPASRAQSIVPDVEEILRVVNDVGAGFEGGHTVGVAGLANVRDLLYLTIVVCSNQISLVTESRSCDGCSTRGGTGQ
jgi:hypothetical protein